MRWRHSNGLVKKPTKYVTCEACANWRLHASHGLCRNCHSNARYADPGYAAGQKKRARENFRFVKFGLTLGQFQSMLEEQGHACAICRSPNDPTPWKTLQVDHCHKTGKVRGLLCRRCNTGLGHYEIQAEGFAKYLSRYVLD